MELIDEDSNLEVNDYIYIESKGSFNWKFIAKIESIESLSYFKIKDKLRISGNLTRIGTTWSKKDISYISTSWQRTAYKISEKQVSIIKKLFSEM